MPPLMLIALFAGADVAHAAPRDSDKDGVPDNVDQCPTLGAEFGDASFVAGVNGDLPVAEAKLRGLAGCPYVVQYGCAIWGDAALECTELDEVATRIGAILSATNATADKDPKSPRYMVLVDGLEDVTDVAPRVLDGTRSGGPSDGFLVEGEEAVRALRAWSRARSAAEAIRGHNPGLRAEVGMSHLRQPEGRRGVWVIASPASNSVEVNIFTAKEPPPAPPVEALPPDGFSLGAGFGYARLHGYDMTAVSLSMVVDPRWESRLSFEAAYTATLSGLPVYLTRWEPTQRIDRLLLGMRWSILKNQDRPFLPYVALGAYTEPSIEPAGPWLGVGVTHPMHHAMLDLVVRAPFYFEDKLGYVGVEALLQARWSTPLVALQTQGGR